MPVKGRYSDWVLVFGCVLFQNLTNLDRSERNAPRSQSKSDLLRHIWEKSDFTTTICAAVRRRSLFTCKRGRGLRHSAQMTTPTMTRKISAFFFAVLDWFRPINLDRSRFVRFWKRTQPLSVYHSFVATEWLSSLKFTYYVDACGLWRCSASSRTVQRIIFATY